MQEQHEPIAIVGMGCYFPDAPNPQKYWENIKENLGHIRPLENGECDLAPVYDPNPNAWNKTQTRLGAPIEPFEFPYKKFKGLPPSVLQASDPHLKWGLLSAQDAIDEAKLNIKDVFVVLAGNAYSSPMLRDYSDSLLFYQMHEFQKTQTFQSLSVEEQSKLIEKLNKDYFKLHKKLSVDGLVASMASHLAARIAKLNGFTGGHTAVDSACASSFAALDLGIRRLRAHSSEVAVVGGVGEIIPFFYVYCSIAKTMSDQGSFPFDTRASGFVVGEGAGFLVLKRLSKALEDQNTIHAIIRGIGASSDGSKTSPWAPNKDGQKLAIQRALKQVPYTISDLQYIECHGTGTKVGDLEEVLGIEELLAKENFQNKIAIGSAKGALGHLLTGAGMAGLFRTILALKNKTLPPTVGLKNPITELKLPTCPLFVPSKPLEWKLPQNQLVRRAMVNSFGFGGTNYNLQIEEFNPDQRPHKKPHRTMPKDPIAVVGMGIYLPGAKSPQEFLENLKEGKTFLSDPPIDRWNKATFHAHSGKWKTQTTRGGFCDLPTQKEKMRWKIPPVTLEHIDPNQFRLFYTVEEALKQSGLLKHPDILENTNLICGNMMDSDFLFGEHASVRFHYFSDFIRKNFPALTATQKENLIEEFFEKIKPNLHTFSPDNSTSGIDSMLGARVAKFFNLKGGALSLDAVCATGIVALDFALHALRAGELRASVVCSSNMGMSGPLFCTYNDLTALSQTNEIRPFDKNRDGMILGEGSVAFVLRRLNDAIEDKQEILALVHATGLSSDGTSLQMLSPVKETVKIAFKNALKNFGQSPPPIEFLECHGSGTPIGDQIEMQCAQEIYGSQKPLTLGSVKSTIGHLKVASAFASLAKTILSLKEKKIFPTANFHTPDPYLTEHSQTLCVSKKIKSYAEHTPWAAVNAMGLGGINGHAILSAYEPLNIMTQKKTAFLFPGQSSAYPGMYKNLSQNNSVFKKYLASVDSFCEKKGKEKLSQVLYQPQNSILLNDLFYSQIAPYTFQVAAATFITEELDLEPHLLMGHSVGEVACLCIVRAFDFETGLDILSKRYELVSNLLKQGQPPAGMLVVRANKTTAEKLIQNISNVYIANLNAPDQTVLSGLREDLEKVLPRADLEAIDYKFLSMKQAFHSPILKPAILPFYEFLKNIKFSPMRIPCTSLVFKKIYQDPEFIAESLSQALVAPVPFMDLIELAYENGVRSFIDLGPGTSLKNLVTHNLSSKKDYKVFNFNHPKENDEATSQKLFIEFKHKLKCSEKKIPPQISGSSFEKGVEQGKLWRKNFTDYEWVLGRFPKDIHLNKEGALKNLLVATPQEYLEEMKGIAKGAGVSETQVFLVSTLSSVATSKYGLCSGLITPKSSPNSSKRHHAANYDFPFVTPEDSVRLPRAVLQINSTGKIPFLGVFKLGSPLPLCGINQEGLSITSCAGYPKGDLDTGMSIYALTRTLLENFSSLSLIKDFVSKTSLEGSWILLIHSTKDQKAIKIEWSDKNYKILEEESLYTTNHFQTLELGTPKREDSVLRLERLKTLYENSEAPEKILGDRFDLARGKVTKFSTKNTLNRYNTSVSVIFDPEKKEMQAALHSIPSGNGPFVTYGFQLKPKTLRWSIELGSEVNYKKKGELPFLLFLADNQAQKNSFSPLITRSYNRFKILALGESVPLLPAQWNLVDLTAWMIYGENYFEDFLKKTKSLKKILSLQGLQKIIAVGKLDSCYSEATSAFYKALTLDYPDTKSCFIFYPTKFEDEKLVQKTLEVIQAQDLPSLLVLKGGKFYSQKNALTPIKTTPHQTLSDPTFLITGGAGGITCEIGLALAQKYGGRFILIGRSKLTSLEFKNFEAFLEHARNQTPGLKPIEYKALWEKQMRAQTTLKNIDRYKNLGVEVHYCTLDLIQNNIEKLSEIIKTHGPIDHLIHGAGTERSKKFLDKGDTEFSQIFLSKTLGTNNLLNALLGQPLKSAFFFSSVSAVSGNIGQTDYSATNATYFALHEGMKKKFREVVSKTICWPAWGETGMAIDPAVFSEMKASGVNFISIQDGVQFFLDEFSNESSLDNVICTPSSLDATTRNPIYPSAQERNLMEKWLERVSDLPYIDGIHTVELDQDCPKKIIFVKYFSGKEEFLKDHLVKGVPTLPGVILTEMLLQAASFLKDAVCIRSICFLNPCRISQTQGTRLKLILEKKGIDSYSFQITTPKMRSDGEVLVQDFINCEGSFTLEESQPREKREKEKLKKIIREHSAPLIETQAFYEKLLSKFPEKLGANFHTLKEILYKSDTCILAKGHYKETQAFGRGKFLFHASIFDLMNHCIVEYEPVQKGDLLYLPYEFKEINCYKPFMQENDYFIFLTELSQQENTLHFRAEFFDTDLNLCLEVGEVTHRKYS